MPEQLYFQDELPPDDNPDAEKLKASQLVIDIDLSSSSVAQPRLDGWLAQPERK